MKNETGITLIALIITIIILVILAAVSIRAAYNSGIIDYAINGTQRYIEKGKEEESINSETEGIIASLLSKLDELGNEDNGNNDVPDLLRKYVLGADENGKNIMSIFNPETGEFADDTESIANASSEIIMINLYGNETEAIVYMKYNNIAYKITAGLNDMITTDVVKIYEPNGMEGEIVEYSVDGTVANTADWLVLYDNGTTVDITPVELDNSWTYTLGHEDPAAIAALPTGSDLERAIWSYNNVVDTLNDYCGTIVTNSTKQAVRSVGTGFDITDTSTKYSSTFLANNPTGQTDEGAYNNRGKIGDMNAEQDVVRMSYYSPGNSYETFGYANTGSWYWLASRVVYENSDYVNFGVRFVDVGRRRGRRLLLVECRRWGC